MTKTISLNKVRVLKFASDGTSTKDPSFKAATSPVPSDGVELVTVTVKGTQTFALFLGKGKGELIVNGKATAVKLK